MSNEALEKATAKLKALRAQGIEPKRLNPLEKHYEEPQSLRKAIDAHCFTCMGSGDDPGWRQMIADCTSEAICPLWTVRPHQKRSTLPS